MTVKVIYPMSSDISRRVHARRHINALTAAHDISPLNIALREETFEQDIQFRDIDTGKPFTERRRVYTATLFLDDADATRLLASFCNTQQFMARRVTKSTILLLKDDKLGFNADGFGLDGG